MANQLYTEDGEELYNSNGYILYDNDPEAIEHKTEKTYEYDKPEDYELLKRNIAQVGYSGLDDTQKRLFQNQFDQSKYAQAGGTLPDAIKYVDESAGVNEANKNAGSAYTLGRDILTTAIAPYTAALEYGKDRLFHEGGWAAGEQPYTKYLTDNLEAGNKGEGLVGFLGNPTNLMGGAGSAFKGLPGMGSPLARGVVEGTGISAIDQYNQNGTIDPKALAYSGLIGGIGGVVSDKISTKANEYSDYIANTKRYKEDPIGFIMEQNPIVDKAIIEKQLKQNKIDPSNLYGAYNKAQRVNVETGDVILPPGAEKDLIKLAKNAIANNSNIPRKMSTITEREAREYLEGIITKVEEIPNVNVDITPKNPLNEKHMPLVAMGLGGIGGHYLAGPVGAVLGAGLATKHGQEILDKTLTKAVNFGTKVAVSPAGSVLGKVPYSPLAIGIIDKLVKSKKDTTSMK